MSDEHVHPWDQPEPTTHFDVPVVVTTLQQVLTGLPVGLSYRHVGCTACQQDLQEGQRVTVYAYRCTDVPAWEVARLYCGECAPEAVETPTLRAAQCVASATLGLQSVVAEQLHRICLTDVEVAAQSPPAEGTKARVTYP